MNGIEQHNSPLKRSLRLTFTGHNHIIFAQTCSSFPSYPLYSMTIYSQGGFAENSRPTIAPACAPVRALSQAQLHTSAPQGIAHVILLDNLACSIVRYLSAWLPRVLVN